MNFNISILLLVASAFLFSCKDNGNGKFSKKNGGTFVMAENTEVGSIYPVSITNQVEALIVTQIHESLVKLDAKTLEVIPGLAEKWELSNDGKIITFHLTKGAHFQDDKCYKDGKGPEITSKDIKFTIEHLATKTEDNYQFNTILKDRLTGVNDFFDKKSTTISGIKNH
jgi:ABC-type transport system substrate-binding protein